MAITFLDSQGHRRGKSVEGQALPSGKIAMAGTWLSSNVVHGHSPKIAKFIIDCLSYTI